MVKQNVILILLGLFAACSTEGPWDFDTRYFGISINDKGYITSMKNITVTPHREFSPEDKPSPLMSLYNSHEGVYYYPEKARYNPVNRTFILDYPNGSVARVLLEPQEKYFRLTLKSLSPRNGIDGIQWGSYQTSITNLFGEILGVARDTSELVNYAIGILALDDNTLGGTSETVGDAAPFHYIIHSPCHERFPLPDTLYEGQAFPIGGDGISDVAFYAHKEPWFRILYGNAAYIDDQGRIYLNYHSRDRTFPREIFFSLIPFMEVNSPRHIEVQPIPGVDYIGSSIALWGSPDSTALLDVIKDIVLAEDLPYPVIDGKWVKDPARYTPDVVTGGGLHDSTLSYVSRMGFKAVNLHQERFFRPDRRNEGYLDGKDYERKIFRFSTGNKSYREFAEMAQPLGIMMGVTNITTSLAPGTKDASPVPSDSLCYQQKRILVNNIGPEDTIIIVDDPKHLDEIGGWEGNEKQLNMVKIGKELIHYLGVSEEEPHTLLNVTRGYWGTTPASHQPGDTIYKLQVTIMFGYQGLIPNMQLQDEIAKYYADVCRINGLRYYDFDGQEFLFHTGHGYYGVKRFFRTMFERAASFGIPHIRFSGATLSEGSWHYQSNWNVGGGKNMYDIDTREWGSTTSQGKDLRDVAYSNYFPVSLGHNFPINENSTVEQFEHVQAISVGWGATYMMPLNPEQVEKSPHKDAIFNAIRTWEDARAANAFPRRIKYMLRNPAYDWTLRAGTDADSWTLYRVVDGQKAEAFELARAEGY